MMARSVRDLAWLAGLLEGEGCFSVQVGKSNPLVSLQMTDEDVVRRAAAVGGCGNVAHIDQSHLKNRKDLWAWRVTRMDDAAGLMMTLFPLMGERRKSKINEVLGVWRNHQGRGPYARKAA